MINRIADPGQKRKIAREILEALPDWFGIPESTEQYIRESADEIMVAAEENGQTLGFLCLKRTGDATCEIAVMGVRKEAHRKGYGRRMFEEARRIAGEQGYSFMQVKTVEFGRYPEYDATNLFYRSLGFREFEVFPTLWDENNPCQIYVMAL